MGNKFDLEFQYQLYISLVGLKEAEMHPQQKKQLRETFMGACGQILTLLRDDLSKLDEDEAIEKMQDMINQVGQYFINAANKQN